LLKDSNSYKTCICWLVDELISLNLNADEIFLKNISAILMDHATEGISGVREGMEEKFPGKGAERFDFLLKTCQVHMLRCAQKAIRGVPIDKEETHLLFQLLKQICERDKLEDRIILFEQIKSVFPGNDDVISWVNWWSRPSVCR